MLVLPPVLAHGALGYWDEVVFIGVAVVFIAMMIVSWLRNRGTDEVTSPSEAQSRNSPTNPDRFELE